ncbi:MAG: SusC/RagA family TonB-linked outer membrane protein [Haliscomenobacter sp.]
MKKQLQRSGWLFLLMLLPIVGLWAQAKKISGTVTDEQDGAPLIGATVLVAGTTNGTVTDLDGKYTIEAKKGQTLRFTYTGYATKELVVGDAAVIDMALESEATALDEVVVTALGIKEDKKKLSYSVQEVKGDQLYNTGRDNFLVSLQGRVAGLNMTPSSGQAGASVSIQLRGPSSIDGNNQPLFVVDGLPIDNRTFSQGALVSDQPNRSADYLNRAGDINPADIESITVLKGPEAAALYGIDASSGAIIITTKKGTAGKGRINYDNLFRAEQYYRFPQFSNEYARGFNGSADPTTTSYFGPKLPAGTQLYDNVGAFFRTGFSNTHNLGFEGGTENVSFRLSSSLVNQQGIIPSNDFSKVSIRLSSTAKISSKLEVTSSFNFINTETTSPERGSSGYLISLIQWPSYDDASVYLNTDGTRRKLIGTTSEPDNPFFNVYANSNRTRTRRSIGNFTMSYNPLKWLNVTGRFGVDNYSTIGNQFRHPESVLGITGAGSVESYNEVSMLLNGNLIATAKKSFGDFNATLTFGGSVDDRNYEVTSVRGEKLYIPDYNSVNNTDPTTQRNKLTITRQRLVSALGSFDLGYKSLLYFSVKGRNDWSSTLPVANRSFFYPSYGLSFVFTELPGLSNNSVLSYGKLRGTISQTGKDAPPYRIQPRLVSQTSTGGGFLYDFYGGNPGLKPERTEGFEVGTELKFFKNRIGVDFAYFKNTRFDQIVAQRLSYGTGFIFGLVNGGTFSNYGYEIQLNLTPVKTKQFTWELLANFTTFETNVDNLPADQAEFYNSDTWLYGNARSSAFVSDLQRFYPTINLSGNQRGMGSATAIGGYSYLRNNNGEVLISPNTGLPVVNANFLPIGDRNPDFTLGLTNQFAIGNFNFSFLLDIRKGGDVFNGTEMFLFRNGLSTRMGDRNQPYIFNGVLRDGRENSESPTVNAIQVTPQTRSDFFSAFPESEFVEKDINWIRLRDVSFGYNFSQQALRKLGGLRSLRIFFSGTDLWMKTNYTGADPNVNGNSATTRGAGAFGFDFGTASLPRTFSGGLRIGL